MDDEEDTAKLVCLALREHPSCQLDWIDDPRKAVSHLKSGDYRAVLLDLDLPHIAGIRLLGLIRNDPDIPGIPVVILTAGQDANLLSECLNEGADYFLQKPFKAEDLLAALGAVIRSRSYTGGLNVLSCGGVLLNVKKGQLTVGGRPVRLTFREFQIFAAILQAPGTLVEQARLYKEIWGLEFLKGRKIPTKTLYTHVENIRKKLEPYSELLETVPFKGYRFNKDLAEKIPSPGTPPFKFLSKTPT